MEKYTEKSCQVLSHQYERLWEFITPSTYKMPAQLCAAADDEKIPTLPLKINDWHCASGLIKSLCIVSNLQSYNVVENQSKAFLLQNSPFISEIFFYMEEAIYFIYIYFCLQFDCQSLCSSIVRKKNRSATLFAIIFLKPLNSKLSQFLFLFSLFQNIFFDISKLSIWACFYVSKVFWFFPVKAYTLIGISMVKIASSVHLKILYFRWEICRKV